MNRLNQIAKVKSYLKEEQIDAILITHPINRRYLTGFTGTAGIVLITQADQLLITDFRYTKQAESEAKNVTVIEHTGNPLKEVAYQLKRLEINELAFEMTHVTYEQYEQFKRNFKIQLIPVKQVIENIRQIKTEAEISMMERAAEIADLAFEHILSYIKPGIKEIDIANELEFFMRKQGATCSSFAMIVASGWRSALPHGVASEKKIDHHELVTLDFGALYKGYCSDITRTVAVGNIDKQLEEIYNIVLQAQKLAVANIKPGLTGKEADAIARDYIEKAGYGDCFGHSTGHGLGMEVHEEPRLAKTSETILEKGMIVTVEPGIYLPGIGGCRIEDDIVLTESGNERLTHSNKELIYL